MTPRAWPASSWPNGWRVIITIWFASTAIRCWISSWMRPGEKALAMLAESAGRKRGHVIVDHALEIEGTCEQCQ